MRQPSFRFRPVRVPFASRSVEQKWGAIETVLPGTLDAIDSGTFYADPAHAERIRDLIVLHFIRSIQSDVIRWRMWDQCALRSRRYGVMTHMRWRIYRGCARGYTLPSHRPGGNSPRIVCSDR